MAAGATIGSTKDAFQQDIVLKVRPPSAEKEVGLFKEGGRLISFVYPAQNKELVEKMQAKKLTVLGMFRVYLYFTYFYISRRGMWSGCWENIFIYFYSSIIMERYSSFDIS